VFPRDTQEFYHEDHTPRPLPTLSSPRLAAITLLLALSAFGCDRAVEPASGAVVDAGSTPDARADARDSEVPVDTGAAMPTGAATPRTPHDSSIAPSPTRAAPATPAATVHDDLAGPTMDPGTVHRAALARQIVAREPVDTAREFSVGPERLYAFFEFTNPSDEAMPIEVRFERPDGSSSRAITLNVPANAPRYRSWAYTRGARRAGRWAAVARTMDGAEVARLPFVIAPSSTR